jgi:hypothetical protein
MAEVDDEVTLSAAFLRETAADPASMVTGCCDTSCRTAWSIDKLGVPAPAAPRIPPAPPLAEDAAAILAALFLLLDIVFDTLGDAEAAACCRTEPGTEDAALPLAAIVAACVEALWVAGLKLQAAQTWMCVRTVSSG